jgi:hypothetical protein
LPLPYIHFKIIKTGLLKPDDFETQKLDYLTANVRRLSAEFWMRRQENRFG